MQEAMDSSASLTSTVAAELKMNAAVTMNTYSKAIGTCVAYIRQLKGDLESPRMWGLARSTTAPKGFVATPRDSDLQGGTRSKIDAVLTGFQRKVVPLHPRWLNEPEIRPCVSGNSMCMLESIGCFKWLLNMQ